MRAENGREVAISTEVSWKEHLEPGCFEAPSSLVFFQGFNKRLAVWLLVSDYLEALGEFILVEAMVILDRLADMKYYWLRHGCVDLLCVSFYAYNSLEYTRYV